MPRWCHLPSITSYDNNVKKMYGLENTNQQRCIEPSNSDKRDRYRGITTLVVKRRARLTHGRLDGYEVKESTPLMYSSFYQLVDLQEKPPIDVMNIEKLNQLLLRKR